MTIMEQLRAGVYGRVSKDPTGRWKSVNDQLYDYEEDREAHPWWLEVGRYLDNDRSASEMATKDRPEFIRMVADIAAGKLDLIWCWDLSRFTREMATFMVLRQLMREKKMKFYLHSAERMFDLTKMQHVSDLTDLAKKAEDEAFKMAERSHKGIRSSLRTGKPHGMVPYGYRRVYDNMTRELIRQEACPESGPIVVEIFDRVSAGHPLLRIANDFTEREIPTPTDWRKGRAITKPWRRSSIRAIVTNPVYVGERRHRGNVRKLDGSRVDIAPGIWPALVSMEKHEMCLRQVSDEKRDALTSEQRVNGRPGAAKYLLSFIMRCERCRSLVQVQLNGTVYRCAKAGHVQIPVEMADEFVLAVVAAWLRRGEFNLSEDLSTQILAAREAASEARREYDNAVRMLREEKISLMGFTADEPRMLRCIDETKKALRELSIPAPLQKLMEAEDPGQAFLDADLVVQRSILTEMFSIVLHGVGRRGKFRVEQIEIQRPE